MTTGPVLLWELGDLLVSTSFLSRVSVFLVVNRRTLSRDSLGMLPPGHETVYDGFCFFFNGGAPDCKWIATLWLASGWNKIQE